MSNSALKQLWDKACAEYDREQAVLWSAWFGELEAALADAVKAEAEAGQQEDLQCYHDAGKDIGALRRTMDIMRRRCPNKELSD